LTVISKGHLRALGVTDPQKSPDGARERRAAIWQEERRAGQGMVALPQAACGV